MQKKEEFSYKIVLATQIGKKSGKLFLSVVQNHVDGFLEVLGRKQTLKGELNADGCVLEGQLRTLLSVFDYTAVGRFDGNGVTLLLSYKYGTMRLTGRREASADENC